MKKKISALLIFFLTLSSFMGFMPVREASAATGELYLGQNVSSWIMDEANGYIYAVTNDTNKLLFIRLSDLQVEQELAIGSLPSDIDMDNGKLFITLSGSTQAKVVDIPSKSVVDTLTFSFVPYKIAIDGDKIFYVQYDQHTRLYVYDLVNKTNEEIIVPGDTYTSYYEPDLVVDPVQHILYIGESAVSGSNIEALSTVNYERLQQSTYDDGYGFPYANRKVILDGQDIFYAKRMLDATDLAVIHGNYLDKIVYVKNNFVFSLDAVYDRETFIKKATLPYSSEFILMDAANSIYMFNSSTKKIVKLTLNDLLWESSSVHQTTANKLILGDEITDWVIDDATGYIYAVSQDANKLLYIRIDNMTVESEQLIGSMPTDIELYNGKLYIALSGTTKFAVTDAVYGSTVQTEIVETNPYRIVVGQDNLYYAAKDQGDKIYDYQLLTKQLTKIVIPGEVYYYFSGPYLKLDEANNLLYVGESGTSGGNLVALSTFDYTKMDETTYDEGYGFPYPRPGVIKDGADIFYAGHRLDASDLSIVLGNFTEHVLYVNGDYVFTENAIYDRNSYAKIEDLPFSIQMAMMNGDGEVFLYDQNQTIHKYASVQQINLLPPQNFSWKLTEQGLSFQWSPVSNAIGYNMYYELLSAPGLVKLNEQTVTDTVYTISDMSDSWYGETVAFGVTTVVYGGESTLSDTFSFTFKDNNVDSVEPPSNSTNNNDNNGSSGETTTEASEEPANDGTVDLSDSIIETVETGEDGTTTNTVEVDQDVFDSILEESGDDAEQFELNIPTEADSTVVRLFGGIFYSLKGDGYDRKLSVRTENGIYILPVNSINIDDAVKGLENTYIEIEISKVTDQEWEKEIAEDGLSLVTQPLKFTVRVVNGDNNQEIVSFGSYYAERWIPIPRGMDNKYLVGIFFEQNNSEYQSVATMFTRDEEGNDWAVLKRNGNSVYAVVKTDKTFTDIQSHWAKSDIELLATKLVVNGMTQNEFNPNGQVTRAQYVTMLTRAMGLTSLKEESNLFTDVRANDWYAGSVNAAVQAGLVTGYQDGSFKPGKVITREEMVVFTVRALEFVQGKQTTSSSALGNFADENAIAGWAKNDVAVALEKGLIRGKSETWFAPGDTANRAESAVVLKRLMEQLGFISY